MNEMPLAELSPVQRLNVLAAGFPGSVVVERTYSTNPDALWDLVSDLERTVPRIQSHVRRFSIEQSHGDRLTAVVHGYGLRARMDAVLQPRWCVMQSRFLVVAMAVDAAPEGARFARLQALRVPAARSLGGLVRRNVGAELTRLGELL